MKKIALLMESWERYFTFAWVSGILKRIEETGINAQLYIFNCSANWSSDELFNKGEHNIFELPELSDFDGIVIELTNTRDPETVERLLERIRRSGVPAVSIGNAYQGLYHVSVDNYGAEAEMFDHLYQSHGCRSFWAVMGPENSYENRLRTQAVRDRAAQLGLPPEALTVWFKDFSVKAGSEAFSRLFQEQETLPDAIICANDNLAAGVLREAQSRGFDAPRDFLITGFDDMDKARYFIPRISTVSYHRGDMGERCVDILIDLWAGREVPPSSHIESQAIFWESCGCSSDTKVELAQYVKDTLLYSTDREYFESGVMAMSARLVQCESMSGMIRCILESIPAFRCDALYLVVDRMFERINYGGAKAMELAEIAEYEKKLRDKGYSQELSLIFSYENGTAQEHRRRIRGLFPLCDAGESGTDVLFLPLHIRDRCIGFLAVRNAVYLMEKQYLFSIMYSLLTAIEQLYARTKLAAMNETLSMLYHHDSMTRFYNRSGYTDLAQKHYEKARAEGRRLAVIFYDLDRLKYINDSFGHEEGDLAIKLTAQVIERSSSSKAMCFRLGGDEFLVLDEFGDEDELRGRIESACRELRSEGLDRGLKTELSVSAGYVITDPESPESLESYVNRADDLMYAAKRAKKMSR